MGSSQEGVQHAGPQKVKPSTRGARRLMYHPSSVLVCYCILGLFVLNLQAASAADKLEEEQDKSGGLALSQEQGVASSIGNVSEKNQAILVIDAAGMQQAMLATGAFLFGAARYPGHWCASRWCGTLSWPL
eukprot:scaffold65097_cov18-Tisochrysis_lutea.AAC.1